MQLDDLLKCLHPDVHDYLLGDTMWCPRCGAIAPKTNPDFRTRNPDKSWIWPSYDPLVRNRRVENADD
jgi:hypothetical protein